MWHLGQRDIRALRQLIYDNMYTDNLFPTVKGQLVYGCLLQTQTPFQIKRQHGHMAKSSLKQIQTYVNII